MIKNNIIKTTTNYNDDFIIFENAMEPNINVFNDEELEVLKKLKDFKNKTATELTSWSHDFMGWKKKLRWEKQLTSNMLNILNCHNLIIVKSFILL